MLANGREHLLFLKFSCLGDFVLEEAKQRETSRQSRSSPTRSPVFYKPPDRTPGAAELPGRRLGIMGMTPIITAGGCHL